VDDRKPLMTNGSQPAASGRMWKLILERAKKRELVPVIGPGIVTFGEPDTHREKQLYPWLLDQLAADYGLSRKPESFNSLVSAVRRSAGEGDVRDRMYDKIKSLEGLPPSPLMELIASLPNCDTFLSLSCDPLLEFALKSVRKTKLRKWNLFGCNGKDLPTASADSCVLGYLFGEVSFEDDSFHLWDADAIEFALALRDMRTNKNAFPHLNHILDSKALLFIGADMSDWALRFLMRVVKNRRLSERANQELFLTESHDGRSDDPVAFFTALDAKIHFQHVDDPVEFTRSFCLNLKSALAGLEVMPGESGTEPPPLEQQAFAFISYAHEDKEAAVRIAAALKRVHVPVWFDEERLCVGDKLDAVIDSAIKDCTLFISVISRSTQERFETYVRIERDLFARVAKKRLPGSYLPVVIDETVTKPSFGEPEEFWKDSTIFEKAQGGYVSEVFLNSVKTKLNARHQP